MVKKTTWSLGLLWASKTQWVGVLWTLKAVSRPFDWLENMVPLLAAKLKPQLQHWWSGAGPGPNAGIRSPTPILISATLCILRFFDSKVRPLWSAEAKQKASRGIRDGCFSAHPAGSFGNGAICAEGLTCTQIRPVACRNIPKDGPLGACVQLSLDARGSVT